MFSLQKIAAAVCVLGATSFAQASTISINTIDADWTPAVLTDGTAPNFINSDGRPGNEEMRWGTPVSGAGKSGYRFDSSTTPLVTDTDVDFVLGNFTHFNFPIYPPSLSHAQLNVHLNFTVDGSSPFDKIFKFNFNHDETTNSGPNNCCNDLVSISNLVTSDVFNIGGDNYTLDLSGFSQNGHLVDTFSTVEGLANRAQLIGRFEVAHLVSVPEPTSLMLFAFGLLSVFGLRRKAA